MKRQQTLETVTVAGSKSNPMSAQHPGKSGRLPLEGQSDHTVNLMSLLKNPRWSAACLQLAFADPLLR